MRNTHEFPSTEAVSDIAPAALSNEALEVAIATLSAELDAGEHRLLLLIRDFDQRKRYAAYGLPSTAAWLSWKVGLGMVAAREKVRVARALADLPKIEAAFSKAEVSDSKVRAMTRVATSESEGRILYMATQATAAQLETICQGVAQVTDRSKEGLKRTLRFSPDRDGMVRLEVRLGADDAALLKTALSLAEKEETDASAEAPLTPSDAIDRKVQALVRIADAFVKGPPPEGRPGADRHSLTVIIREEAASPEGHIAELPDHGSVGHIAKKCLERLCCDATLVEADTGRKQRVVSGPMRRALLARDGGCRFPGCHQRKWVDAHHIIPWLEGGPTTKDNLVILCTRHHRLLHEGGYKLTGPASSMQFSRPTGQVIRNIDPPAIPRNRLPKVRAPKAPDTSFRPNYHYAIGAALTRTRKAAGQHEPSVASSRNAKAEVHRQACAAPRSSAH